MKRTGGLWLVLLAMALAEFMPAPARAQLQGSSGFAPSQQQFAPATGPSSVPSAPSGGALSMRSPPAGTIPQVQSGQAALIVSARFSRDFPQPITSGLIWRIYPAKPDPSRPFVPIKEEHAAAPVFVLPPGDYVVHVAFGLASAARPVSLRTETTREIFDLPA